MAKNISIREGDTSKQFTAKKLKMNLVGGGTANFVPEDEAVDYVDLKDHTFREAGIFNPSDFNCDGFKQVTIDIPADVKPKTITQNGEYYAADDNCLGYSKVTVAVPSGGGGGPYTVRFFDDDRQTILKTDANVPYGGSASCTLLDGTIVGGEYFKGWNPTPTNVRGDMNCYPMRGDYVIDANEIQDSWETICANKGANYPLGSYKSLIVVVNGTTDITKPVAVADTYTNRNFSSSDKYTTIFTAQHENDILFSYQFYMVKVAEGEDGSTSTWLSTGCAELPNDFTAHATKGETSTTFSEPRNIFVDFSHWPDNNKPCVRCGDWDVSPIRQFLNNWVLANMPASLINTIKPVTKYTRGITAPNTTSVVRVQKSSIDKIWIPSVKELHTFYSSPMIYSISTNPSNLSALEEVDGIDYSAVYVPTWPLGTVSYHFVLRTNNLHQFEGTYSSMVDTFAWNNYYGVDSYAGNHRLPVYVPFGFCL